MIMRQATRPIRNLTMLSAKLFAGSLVSIILVVALPSQRAMADAADPVVLPLGDFRLAAAAGPVSLQGEWTWGLEASVRVGLPFGFEFGGPLALGYSLISTNSGAGLMLSAGVVDMWVTDDGRYLWTPAAILSAQLRAAHSASLRIAFDITGVEEGLGGGDHPAWWRGAVALLIDMGPFLTISMGVSHQRLFVGEGAPVGSRRSGWVGDARLTLGAVRAQPFEELPTVAVHLTDWISIIGLVTFAIDTDLRTTDARYLAGLRLDLSLF